MELRAEGQEVILDGVARMAGSSALPGSDAETMLVTLEGKVSISRAELAGLVPDQQLAAVLKAGRSLWWGTEALSQPGRSHPTLTPITATLPTR